MASALVPRIMVITFHVIVLDNLESSGAGITEAFRVFMNRSITCELRGAEVSHRGTLR